MNKVILIGRLTRDPEIRYSNEGQENSLTIARYTLAVDRRFAKRDGNNDQQTADFISCVGFGKQGEFAEKYLKQGIKIAVEGRIQTGSYTNKEGQKIFTTEVVVENQEFCEKKSAENDYNGSAPATTTAASDEDDGYVSVNPDDDDLPFKG